MLETMLAEILTTAGGTGIALVILYFYMKANQVKIGDVAGDLVDHERSSAESKIDMLNRIKKAEDCFESELKDVKKDIGVLCTNTTAIVQHLVTTTDRKQHPHAVHALETVLEKKSRGG